MKKISRIAIFQDIKLKDLETTIQDESIASSAWGISDFRAAQQKQQPQKFDELRKVFYSVDQWVQHTNLLCWYCSDEIKSYPKFIPVVLKSTLSGEQWNTLGYFCEWSCAEAYGEANCRDLLNMWDLRNHIAIMRQKFDGGAIHHVPPSISPTRMKKYCGEEGLTEDEYRQELQHIRSQFARK
ncbi:MAG: hypothetical protein M0R33_17010 [Methylomonas sp.]|jgi:hypothetical protein|uniref:hypothetical protein n=1 Tax=Methylomonas sp. TaxID=418 RepID=UPI0025F559E2|nr:hypothetical protein [Methylomonas sp.]MCK9608146.1 hypothetical protein [Methylomonas sp.]